MPPYKPVTEVRSHSMSVSGARSTEKAFYEDQFVNERRLEREAAEGAPEPPSLIDRIRRRLASARHA